MATQFGNVLYGSVWSGGSTSTTTSITTESRDLVSTEDITYIKEMNVNILVRDIRPNAKLKVFFDGIDVTSHCYTKSPAVAHIAHIPESANVRNSPDFTPSWVSPLVADANGNFECVFAIPPTTFTTGNKELVVTDADSLDQLEIVNNTYGSAKSTFTAKGTIQTFQTTRNNIKITVNQNFFLWDPLAQSFFTYGEPGGIFVTSIDVYFRTKDLSIPVRCEIRKMVNGYPEKLDQSNPDLVCSLLPSQVNTSPDASVATKFKFPTPVYLPENGDYCFVLFTNSKNYEVWTSKLGERSIETGFIIHDQPYVGSLFKSENNITWTAYQFEDLKFRINKAEFQVGSAEIELKHISPTQWVYGSKFTTTNGSDRVLLKYPTKHGLRLNDYISLDVDPAATLNGISAANFKGHRQVTNVFDDYVVEFSVGAAATTSGTVNTSGAVLSLLITNGGSGYTSKPTVTISPPVGGGTTAVVQPDDIEIYDGRIVSIRLKQANKGSGYGDVAPIVTITGGGGSGATAIANVVPVVAVTTNVRASMLVPQFRYGVFDNTEIYSEVTTRGIGGASQSTTRIDLDAPARLNAEAVVFTGKNEEIVGDSLRTKVYLSSQNPNVSPFIDLRKTPTLQSLEFAMTPPTPYESTSSTSLYGTVATIEVTSGGSGYTTASATIVPAPNERSTAITPATATVTVAGGVVTAVTVTSAGDGYTVPPLVLITGDGVGATASAVLTQYNSELATEGTSRSRYITKRVTLQTPSKDARLLAQIYSTPITSVDWYIRTSLSSDAISNHEDQPWVLMKCDVARDKSKKLGQFFEYEFYTDGNVGTFDTYDLKCIMRTRNYAHTPHVKNYRVIVLA